MKRFRIDKRETFLHIFFHVPHRINLGGGGGGIFNAVNRIFTPLNLMRGLRFFQLCDASKSNFHCIISY